MNQRSLATALFVAIFAAGCAAVGASSSSNSTTAPAPKTAANSDESPATEVRRPLEICPEYLPVCLDPNGFSVGNLCTTNQWDKWPPRERTENLHKLATSTWQDMLKHLYRRPEKAGFRQLMGVIENELAGWKQLIVLEGSGQFVVYGQTPKGWQCLTNVTQSTQGFVAGKVVARPVEARWINGWRWDFIKADLPQAAFGDTSFGGGFRLHVMVDQEEAWTSYLGTPTAAATICGDEILRDFGPVPQERIAELRAAMQTYREGRGRGTPEPQPKVVFAPGDKGYSALVNAYALPARKLWENAVGLPDFAPWGGKEKALAAVEALKSVGGSAVGVAGSPGKFYLLSKPFIYHATRQDIEKMLASKKPIVCAMGITAAAHSSLPDRVKLIASTLSRPEEFEMSPFGCEYEVSSVGKFAMIMLTDPAYLDMGVESIPLVDPDLLALYCLAKDDCFVVQPAAEDLLSRQLERGKVPLDLAKLKKLWPGSDDVTLLKALARGSGQEDIHKLLIAHASDKNARAEVRLAAASGLTRYPEQADVDALAKLRDELNQLEKGAGTMLLERARQRQNILEPLCNAKPRFIGSPSKETVDLLTSISKSATPLTHEEIYKLGVMADPDHSQRIKALALGWASWDVFSDQAAALYFGPLKSAAEREAVWKILKSAKPAAAVPDLPNIASQAPSAVPSKP